MQARCCLLLSNQEGHMSKKKAANRSRSLLLIAFGLIAANALAAQTPMPSATFVVTSTQDVVDARVGDGICAARVDGAMACTLRAAVQEANHQPGVVEIRLMDALYTLTIPTTESIFSPPDASVGDLDLLGDVRVVGTRSANSVTRITSENRFRIFEFSTVIVAKQVELRDLVLEHATAEDGRGGGCILDTSHAHLEILRVSFNDCSTLRTHNPRLPVPDGNGGGAIRMNGILDITASSFARNVAWNGPGAVFEQGGGAIHCEGGYLGSRGHVRVDGETRFTENLGGTAGAIFSHKCDLDVGAGWDPSRPNDAGGGFFNNAFASGLGHAGAIFAQTATVRIGMSGIQTHFESQGLNSHVAQRPVVTIKAGLGEYLEPDLRIGNASFVWNRNHCYPTESDSGHPG